MINILNLFILQLPCKLCRKMLFLRIIGAFERYTFAPQGKDFIIGGCSNISIALNTPCCTGDKPCPLVRESFPGSVTKLILSRRHFSF